MTWLSFLPTDKPRADGRERDLHDFARLYVHKVTTTTEPAESVAAVSTRRMRVGLSADATLSHTISISLMRTIANLRHGKAPTPQWEGSADGPSDVRMHKSFHQRADARTDRATEDNLFKQTESILSMAKIGSSCMDRARLLRAQGDGDMAMAMAEQQMPVAVDEDSDTDLLGDDAEKRTCARNVSDDGRPPRRRLEFNTRPVDGCIRWCTAIAQRGSTGAWAVGYIYTYACMLCTRAHVPQSADIDQY